MAKKKKISIPTKFLSNRRYLNEVPVEGKKTRKFYFKIGYYDLYAAQIIRSGNCITLLSNEFSITEDSFWNSNHFEDLTKFVFWTFNKSFLLKLVESMGIQKLSVLKRCRELLAESPIPYGYPIPERADEELRWCYVKQEYLKKEKEFNQMFSLDQENRKAFLSAVEKKVAEPLFPIPQSEKTKQPDSAAYANSEPVIASKDIPFLEVLNPTNGRPEETLRFIIEKVEEADFGFNIFSPVRRLPNGKNQYGLNGCIGAMIDFFYQYKYFKKECTLEDIFKAYFLYSGNHIAKLRSFLSEFREDNSYSKHFSKLKSMKINKLS